METMSKVTDKHLIFNGNPKPLPNFSNVGPLYMATFSLPRFIGLHVWLILAYLIPNTLIALAQTIFSPELISPCQHHQCAVDPSPSSSNVSSSISSSSVGKILNASNQMTKRKKKGEKKKNLDKKVVNQPTMSISIGNFEGTSTMHGKTKYPCKICKGDNFLVNYPSIPKVLEVWSNNSRQHIVDPSISHSHILREKIKVKFPCRLCKGTHHSHL